MPMDSLSPDATPLTPTHQPGRSNSPEVSDEDAARLLAEIDRDLALARSQRESANAKRMLTRVLLPCIVLAALALLLYVCFLMLDQKRQTLRSATPGPGAADIPTESPRP